MGMDRYMEEIHRQPEVIRELQAELAGLHDKYDELGERYRALRVGHEASNEKLQQFQAELVRIVSGAKAEIDEAWDLIDKMIPYVSRIPDDDPGYAEIGRLLAKIEEKRKLT